MMLLSHELWFPSLVIMTAITFAGKYFSDALLLKSHDIDDDDQRYEHRAVTSDVETDAISSDCSQGMKMPIATLPPGQSRPRLQELEGVSIPSFNICRVHKYADVRSRNGGGTTGRGQLSTRCG